MQKSLSDDQLNGNFDGIESFYRFQCDESVNSENDPTETLADLLAFAGVSSSRILSKQMMQQYGSLNHISSTPIELIAGTAGVNAARAIFLFKSFMIATLQEKIARRPVIKNTKALVSLLHADIGFKNIEHFLVVFLRMSCELITLRRLSKGTFSSAPIDIPKIIQIGLNLGAAKIILAHNHPSGNPSPSRQDLEITNRLRKLAFEFDIKVLEHVIVSDRGFSTIYDWNETNGSVNSDYLQCSKYF